jgi:hypothetical protein
MFGKAHVQWYKSGVAKRGGERIHGRWGEVTGHLYMYAGMVGRNIGQIYVRDFRVRVMNFVTFVISEGSSVYEL